MQPIIKEILETIEKNGFEAYLIGGYVREHLLNHDTNDVDICTNALPRDIKLIFNNIVSDTDEYGGISFKMGDYDITITTYRKEIKYTFRWPTKMEYINNLLEDIKRRDFTINTICMDKDENITDIMNAQQDLKEKIIKAVGDPNFKLNEDPLRILRAIRFATLLNFSLDEQLELAIVNNAKKVKALSFERKRSELDKILLSENRLKGLELIKKYRLNNYLDIRFDNLVTTDDLLGMWSQIKVDKRYPFSKDERNIMTKINALVINNTITKKDIFNYGLYICSVAGSIIGIDRVLINQMYQELPIKEAHDLVVGGEEIIKSLNIKPSKIIKDILNDLTDAVIDGKVENEITALNEYIIGHQRKWINDKSRNI